MKFKIIYIIMFAFVILFSGCSATLQNLPKASSDQIGNYKLQPGDKVELVVFQPKDLSGEYTIGPDGKIALPLGGHVYIADLARDEAEKVIQMELAQYYDPLLLTLKISSFQSNDSFVILGAVKKPGAYTFQNQLTITEALGKAEGLLDNADKKRLRLVRSKDVYDISLDALIERADSRQNIIIQKDDLIYVPKTKTGSFFGHFNSYQPFIQILLLAAVTLNSIK